MIINAARDTFLTRLDELKASCNQGSPWVFVCASAMVDYLSRLVAGKNLRGPGYKDFIEKWMVLARPQYTAFRYKSGHTDLPAQMYHVLRCGIIHSLSLIPDSAARKDGGRDRSIWLCHRSESLRRMIPHLSNYSTSHVPDAASFVAEDFLDDIELVMKNIFSQAIANPNGVLSKNINTWLLAHPLISGAY